MAPAVGFEPTTKWLTATYSTAELCRNIFDKSATKLAILKCQVGNSNQEYSEFKLIHYK